MVIPKPPGRHFAGKKVGDDSVPYKPLDPDPGRRGRRAIIALALLAIVTGLVIVLAGGSKKTRPARSTSKPVVADFALKTLSDSIFRLSSLRGRPAVLSFWSSTCPASRLAVPAFRQLAAKFENRDVAFVSVALGDRRDSLDKFVKQSAVDYPVLLGTDSVAKAFDIRLLPTWLVIDRAGAVGCRVEGYAPDSGLVELDRVLSGLPVRRPGRK